MSDGGCCLLGCPECLVGWREGDDELCAHGIRKYERRAVGCDDCDDDSVKAVAAEKAEEERRERVIATALMVLPGFMARESSAAEDVIGAFAVAEAFEARAAQYRASGK